MHLYLMLAFQKVLTSVFLQDFLAIAAGCSGAHLESWLAGGRSCAKDQVF